MNRNNTTRSSITGDPFSDANLLENQPRGLKLEPDNGQTPRNSTSSESSGSRDILRGAGTLVKWSPGHDRRRRSQLQTPSRLENPSFVFPQTQLLRPPGPTHQHTREQQPSSHNTKSADSSEDGTPLSVKWPQFSSPFDDPVSSEPWDSAQDSTTLPQRAFPLACEKKELSSSNDSDEALHEKSSHTAGSSINFSRPLNLSISKVHTNPDVRTPMQLEHLDNSIERDQILPSESDEFGSKKEAEKDQNQSTDLIPGTRQRSSCVLLNRRKSKYTIEEEKVVRAEGKKRLRWTRNVFIIFMLIANGVCIAISWVYPKYWYVFAPVILLGNVLNSLMVLNIIRWYLWGQILPLLFKKALPPPPTHIPTTIAMVLACYCESYQDLMDTLESLNAQEKVEHHKKMFIIICDGQVKGKGMTKSTDRILVEDILKPKKELWFPMGYESWDGAINGIYASAGIWEGTPYVLLVKKRNLGKRDGLILVRTLLYKYRFRHENPETTMGDDFFRWFCEFSEDCAFENFEWLVGVDADTTFNSTCIYEMHKECLKDPKLVGCSGLIQVGFRTGQWNLWNIYQNTEYIRAQLLRRWHQAHGTGKVSCLPGACQIIKICEETCSDEILIDLFGHIPDPKANMIHQIRALAGEDRNYICLIFFRFPKSQTTMSLKAIAYTDPPNGSMVFLSQRKRWTLSTCANDWLITSKNKMNWFERLCSLADVIVWVLNLFVMQTLALFIKACIAVENPTFIVCFAIVTMIPLTYGIFVAYWGCETNRLRLQYLLGLLMLVLIGQIVTPIVICYAIWHMDDFSWGKTREIEASDNPDDKPAHS